VHLVPPFKGPLALPLTEMDRYYDAYGAFEMLVDDSLPLDPYLSSNAEEIRRYRECARRFTWEKRLAEGEILLFNNQRMLHGRRGFRVWGGVTVTAVAWCTSLRGAASISATRLDGTGCCNG